jgi:hypothetical protein
LQFVVFGGFENVHGDTVDVTVLVDSMEEIEQKLQVLARLYHD